MLVSDGYKKPHLIGCEATCVHEEAAKRIPTVRFTEKRFLLSYAIVLLRIFAVMKVRREHPEY